MPFRFNLMRVLLVGDDAVAHAVAEHLARNCDLYALMETPNPGITKSTQQSYVCDFSNIEAIGSWALRKDINLVFITAEEALNTGLVDALQDAGFQVASPTMDAATIGHSRTYARNILRKYVNFPRFLVCKNIKDLKAGLKDFNRIVLKPAVRSAWKGLKFADLENEKVVLKEAKTLIKAHGSVIIEERIDGEEFTLQALSDGKNVALFPPTQVAKAAFDHDIGENTEGMASYSTGKLLPFLSEEDFDQAKNMLQKIISVLGTRGSEYKGILHARFIVSAKGVKLVDLRSSFDNPEGINCMGLLKTQFVEILQCIVDGNLKPPSFSDKPSVVKYAVPLSYPSITKKVKKKKEELILDEKKIWDSGIKFYFEGLEKKDDKYFLTDKRAVALFATGETLEEAEQRVSFALASLSESVRWRKDVATKQYVESKVKRAKALKGSFLFMKPIVKK